MWQQHVIHAAAHDKDSKVGAVVLIVMGIFFTSVSHRNPVAPLRHLSPLQVIGQSGPRPSGRRIAFLPGLDRGVIATTRCLSKGAKAPCLESEHRP